MRNRLFWTTSENIMLWFDLTLMNNCYLINGSPKGYFNSSCGISGSEASLFFLTMETISLFLDHLGLIKTRLPSTEQVSLSAEPLVESHKEWVSRSCQLHKWCPTSLMESSILRSLRPMNQPMAPSKSSSKGLPFSSDWVSEAGAYMFRGKSARSCPVTILSGGRAYCWTGLNFY